MVKPLELRGYQSAQRVPQRRPRGVMYRVGAAHADGPEAHQPGTRRPHQPALVLVPHDQHGDAHEDHDKRPERRVAENDKQNFIRHLHQRRLHVLRHRALRVLGDVQHAGPRRDLRERAHGDPRGLTQRRDGRT